MVLLEPMNPEEFETSLARAIPRHAEHAVRIGIWTKEGALEASRREFEEKLPQGLATPDRHFAKVIDETTRTPIGEAWWIAGAKGGKVWFWIDWLWIDPEFRRRGHALDLLRTLEEEARRIGADRVALGVAADNLEAGALYAKAGYVPWSTALWRVLSPMR